MKDLKFSSLFREFISLIIVACSILKGGSLPVFVPFQGIHFFNKEKLILSVMYYKSFRPFSGNSFL